MTPQPMFKTSFSRSSYDTPLDLATARVGTLVCATNDNDAYGIIASIEPAENGTLIKIVWESGAVSSHKTGEWSYDEMDFYQL